MQLNEKKFKNMQQGWDIENMCIVSCFIYILVYKKH